MLTGFHFLGEDGPTVSAATFLDVAGSGPGMRATERLCRVYFKGRAQPDTVAQQALAWHSQGARVQLGNEPNLAAEQFGGGPAEYRDWFASVRLRVNERGGARLYWAGMSPGVPGWQAWYEGAHVADGIAAHAYGTFDQMRATVEPLLAIGVPIWLAEVNFGAGQEVNRDTWARDHLRPFLDWCAGRPLIEAVTYFAWRWPTPDMPLPTPVDAAGTAIERVLQEWRAPAIGSPPSAPATKESEPMIHGIDASNNQGWIDWDRVAAHRFPDDSSVRFAFLKASGDEGDDGVFLDGYFPRNWSECLRVGIIPYPYHFCRPDKASPARSVTTLQESLARVGGLPAGGQPVLYSGWWWMKPHNVYGAEFGRRPLWYASYQDTQPAPPPGWDRLTFWQYSASGRVDGVEGDCDLDVFFGTEDELRAMGALLAGDFEAGDGDCSPWAAEWLDLAQRAICESPASEPSSPASAPVPVPPEVLSAFDVLWSYAGPDVEKQRAIVGAKIALGVQEAA